MIIVDKDIRDLIYKKRLIIVSMDKKYPFDPETQIGAGSIDLRFSRNVRKYKSELDEIDLTSSGDTTIEEINYDEELVIMPREVVLTTTAEAVILPADIGGFITGRSSIARLGLMVQCCQDFVNPGNGAQIGLQLVNITSKPIKIKAGLRICQIVLFKGSSESEKPYSSNKKSKYRNEINTPQPSKIGVELGKETEKDLEDDSITKKHSVIVLEKWRREVVKAESAKAVKSFSSKIANPIYIVLGAMISVLVPEAKAENFPSNLFIFSALIIIFCIVLLFILNQRNVEK